MKEDEVEIKLVEMILPSGDVIMSNVSKKARQRDVPAKTHGLT